MIDNEELLFDELYEKTKECGRTQFIKLLMEKERENQELKQKYEMQKDSNKLLCKVISCDDCNCSVCEAHKENIELKKQLEEYKRLGFKHLNDKCTKLENQQKEFINKIKELETKLKENGINE